MRSLVDLRLSFLLPIRQGLKIPASYKKSIKMDCDREILIQIDEYSPLEWSLSNAEARTSYMRRGIGFPGGS